VGKVGYRRTPVDPRRSGVVSCRRTCRAAIGGILAADVAGYSRLMDEDEEGTLAR